MDIRKAFMSGGGRKRKASTSEPCEVETKTARVSSDNNDVEILDEASGITVTVHCDADLGLGDCKENMDINASTVSNGLDNACIDQVKSKEDAEDCKDSVDLKNSLLGPNSTSSPKKDLSEAELCDVSGNFDTSACDELNASTLSSSKEVSLNATGDESDVKGDNSTNSTKTSTKVQVESKPKKKKMTPAEAQKRAEEREKKQMERQKKKEELENKKRERQLEKERKAQEIKIRKEREELERKERERLKEEKKKQEEMERLLKQKQKEEQRLKKIEEQKKKDELKQKKEEEQKRAEEEKSKKEQKEREKAEKEKAAFAKFFKKAEPVASTTVTQTKVQEKEGAFLPFQVLDGMVLAPAVPPVAQERFDRQKLEKHLNSQDSKELYLTVLKSVSYKDVRQRRRIKPVATSDADVIVIDEKAKAELSVKAKLLQFHENIRPPYWGTWRKKSKSIRPRNPLGQDVMFDYDVDSDDEWDEGGPGESLSGTEPEDESEDDYEVDNEFFVPHGYLSDEEEQVEDDDEELDDPEKQKEKLKKKLQEFENERKRKTTELKPIILGCYFANDPRFQDNGIQLFLEKFTAEPLSDSPVPTRFTVQISATPSGSPKSISNSAKKKKGSLVPEDAMPQLIPFVHGNRRNCKSLAEDFQKLWNEQHQESLAPIPNSPAESSNVEVEGSKNPMETDASKNDAAESVADSSLISIRQLKMTIRDIATYGKPPEPSINKCCWWVHQNVREKYGVADVPLPNDKSYVSVSSIKTVDKLLPASNSASNKKSLSSKIAINS